jgi:hypothetical protein
MIENVEMHQIPEGKIKVVEVGRWTTPYIIVAPVRRSHNGGMASRSGAATPDSCCQVFARTS